MRRLAGMLFLFVAAASAIAQSAAPSTLVQRRILFSMARGQGTSFTPGDAVLVSRSLLQRLQEAGAEFILVESSSETADQSVEQLGATARQAGADGWLQVTLGGGWSSAKIGIRSYDLLSHSMVADLTRDRSGWGSPAGLAREGWQDVAQAVVGKFPMVQGAAPADAGIPQARLTVIALPGSTVTGLGKKPVRIEPDGSASLVLPAQQEYELRTSLAGFTPVTQKIFLSADREVKVQQARESQWAMEFSVLDGRAPGLDVSLAFPAQALFVRLGFSTYAAALAFSPTDTFISEPLTNLGLQGGLYLRPSDKFVRFYVGLGGFLRFVHATGTPLTVDAISPFAFHAVLGSEFRLFSGGRLYFEYTPTVFLTTLPDLFRASLGPDTSPGWIFGPGEAIGMISFRIGYRWQL